MEWLILLHKSWFDCKKWDIHYPGTALRDCIYFKTSIWDAYAWQLNENKGHNQSGCFSRYCKFLFLYGLDLKTLDPSIHILQLKLLHNATIKISTDNITPYSLIQEWQSDVSRQYFFSFRHQVLELSGWHSYDFRKTTITVDNCHNFDITWTLH